MAKSHIIFGVMTHSAIETRQQKEQGGVGGGGGWGGVGGYVMELDKI